MNFSIHIDDETAARLKREAARKKRTRNALITEAVKQWLERAQRSEWPEELQDFEGTPTLEPFEKARSKRRQGPRFP